MESSPVYFSFWQFLKMSKMIRTSVNCSGNVQNDKDICQTMQKNNKVLSILSIFRKMAKRPRTSDFFLFFLRMSFAFWYFFICLFKKRRIFLHPNSQYSIFLPSRALIKILKQDWIIIDLAPKLHFSHLTILFGIVGPGAIFKRLRWLKEPAVFWWIDIFLTSARLVLCFGSFRARIRFQILEMEKPINKFQVHFHLNRNRLFNSYPRGQNRRRSCFQIKHCACTTVSHW